MKRIFLFALLIFSAIGLPVTASYAQQPPAPVLDPGCSPDVMNLLVNQSNAIQARNRAYEREILNRQPSTLYLTCFDQAMVLSSRLGYIFSDNIMPDPPPDNTVAFTDKNSYPDWGATHMLALDLDTVVSPVLDNSLDAVPTTTGPALFNFLPQWVPPNQLSTLAKTLNTVMTQIKAFQAGQDATNVKAWLAVVTQIDTLVNSFPTLAWDDLAAAVTQYNTLIAKLTTLLATIDTDRKNIMTPLLAALKNDVFNTTMSCTRLDDMWNKMDPGYNLNQPGAFYPPEGKYYPLSPYYPLADVLAVPPSPPATPDFVAELKSTTDSTILTQALTDLTGPLSQAGVSPVWPAPPVFPQNADAQDVIDKM